VPWLQGMAERNTNDTCIVSSFFAVSLSISVYLMLLLMNDETCMRFALLPAFFFIF